MPSYRSATACKYFSKNFCWLYFVKSFFYYERHRRLWHTWVKSEKGAEGGEGGEII